MKQKKLIEAIKHWAELTQKHGTGHIEYNAFLDEFVLARDDSDKDFDQQVNALFNSDWEIPLIEW